MSNRIRLFILPLIILLFVTPVTTALSAPGDLTDVDTYIQRYMARNHIPGASLTISRAEEVLYAKGYGIAGPNREMTPDTPMFIGSQTKSFTALAVMQLVEAGKLDLNTPIQRYIPWFQVKDPRSDQITIRHLLNHSSGLSEAGYVPNLPETSSLEEAVRDLRHARLTAEVGEKFQYFNMGYVTLGYLVEIVSGQTYGEYIRDHVFDPLGMTRSSATPEDYAGMNMAQGYSQLFAFPIPMKQSVPRFYLPAGFIVSTTNDMSRYLMAMENEGELDGVRILSKAGVHQIFLPNLASHSSAGFGWDIASYYGEKQITHGGATECFNTHVLILPESGYTFVLIINQDHMFKATYDYEAFFWGVVDILTGHPITQQGISSVTIGWGLLGVFLVVVFLSARGLLALREERSRQLALPRHRWLRLLPHAGWIVLTLGMVVFVGPALAGRGFDLRWFTGFYPDVALLAGVVVVAELIQMIVKALVFYTPRISPGHFKALGEKPV